MAFCGDTQTGTIAFDPPALRYSAVGTPISSLHICALDPVPATVSGKHKVAAPPSALTNHWIILFKPIDQKVVRLDPSKPGAGACPIAIVFTELEKDISSDTVATYEVPLESGTTLATIIEMLEKASYAHYVFDSKGVDSRDWVLHLLAFLKECGFVASPLALRQARVCLQQVWLSGGELAAEEQQTHIVPGIWL